MPGVYTADIDADEFSLHLNLAGTQPPLLNGDSGMSRKGPAPQAASYYYSLPHLSVTGTIARNGQPRCGERRSVVRSRVVERIPRQRGGRLGLDRHQFE